MTLTWMLPENISDILPYEAQIVESMRRTILDMLLEHGYEFVIPPLIEYTNTLNLGTQEDLAKKIFKWLDTHSQKMLGIRADMTPQITRIDAHILNTENTTRFSYCDSVLHSRTRAYDTRQPIQIGAEIYGVQDLRADIEILNLMLKSLKIIGLDELNRAITLSISHAGLLPALGMDVRVNSDSNTNININTNVGEIYQAIKHKNYAFLEGWQQNSPSNLNSNLSLNSENLQNQPHQAFLLKLLKSHDVQKVLQLLNEYAAQENLSSLQKIADDFAILADCFNHIQKDLGFSTPVHLLIDVSDVESYQYHTGLEFSFYLDDYPYTIAKGGRYDAMSQAFGKSRPACGFSMNLRQLSTLFIKSSTTKNDLYQKPLIVAPWLDLKSNLQPQKNQELEIDESSLNALKKNIQTLRKQHVPFIQSKDASEQKDLKVAVMEVDIDLINLKAIEITLQDWAKNLNIAPTQLKTPKTPYLDLSSDLSDLSNLPIYHFNLKNESNESAITMKNDLQKKLKINHLQAFEMVGILGLEALYLFD